MYRVTEISDRLSFHMSESVIILALVPWRAWEGGRYVGTLVCWYVSVRHLEAREGLLTTFIKHSIRRWKSQYYY